MRHTIAKKAQEKGAALIAVLVILVIITLLGVTAMRMGVSSLTLATNSQVSQLLFQSADFGTNTFVNQVVADPNVALSTAGVAGDASGAEMIYCVTPVATANFGGTLTAGACNLDQASSFISDREVVATEVTAQRTDVQGYGSNNATNSLSQLGSGDAPLGEQNLKVYSTAVVPSFGSASITEINNCLAANVPSDDEGTDNSDAVTKTDCLTDVGAVFTTHVSEYKIIR